MIEKKVVVNNELGLHARPSAQFVKTSSAFTAEITVAKDGMEVNGKSIMSLMMLAAEPGCELVVRADGADEADALEALAGLFERNFAEEGA